MHKLYGGHGERSRRDQLRETKDESQKSQDEPSEWGIGRPPSLSLNLSGLIRANRCAIRTRIANILFELILDPKKKNLPFANRPSKKWESSEDWTRIMRISMRIGEKTRFGRIWPSASKIGIYLRNIGVRITCPLSTQSFYTRRGI